MQYLLKFKTWIDYFIELNWSRIILNWIFYWIELVKNNFELNILLNWILTVFFWIENWIESFSSEIQSLIESSNCTSQGYPGYKGPNDNDPGCQTYKYTNTNTISVEVLPDNSVMVAEIKKQPKSRSCDVSTLRRGLSRILDIWSQYRRAGWTLLQSRNVATT